MIPSLLRSVSLAAFAARVVGGSAPNVILIMTDDQDAQLQSLDYMPKVEKYLSSQGTQYIRHYATVSQCCPSRVSFLTGKAAHNTNVTNVELPYGMLAYLLRHLSAD
jgi:N-acetylglucosamine-6-sulfatase